MHWHTIIITLLFQLSAAAFFQRPAYVPNPPKQPLRRDDEIQDVLAKRAVSPRHTYTKVTPSPGAKPIAITSQFQVVTSYIPQYTLCPLSVTSAPRSGPSYVPASNSSMLLGRRQASSANATTPPAFPSKASTTLSLPGPSTTLSVPQNYSSTSAPSSTTPLLIATPPYPMHNTTHPHASIGLRTGTAPRSGCTTHYSPTATAICHTVLKGLAKYHTVSDCDQLITYSSHYGYTVTLPPGVTDPATLPPASQPYVETVTTYYEAPWTDFTASTGVPKSVTERICSRASYAGAGRECIDIRKGVQTRVVTSVTTTTSEVDLTTTIPGPSSIIVETFHADITEVETVFVLKTRIVTEVSTEGVVTDTSVLATLGTTMYPGAEASATEGAMGAAPTAMMTVGGTEPTSTSTIKSTTTRTVTSTLVSA